MKKLLLIALLFLLPFSTFAWYYNPLTNRIDDLFRNKWYQDVTYDVDQLEADIIAKADQNWIYENSIQSLSKEPNWNKQTFLSFVKHLQEKNTKKASEIYQRNWKNISPFLPTCCAFMKYLAFRPMKNWIMTLVVSGNGAKSYRIEYLFAKKEPWVNYIYSISTQEILFLQDKSESIVKSYFNNPNKNKEFYRIYDEFMTDMTLLVKNY